VIIKDIIDHESLLTVMGVIFRCVRNVFGLILWRFFRAALFPY
jgi:hypothetical protein